MEDKTLELIASLLYEEIYDFYCHEIDEWADPTGEGAVYLAEKKTQ